MPRRASLSDEKGRKGLESLLGGVKNRDASKEAKQIPSIPEAQPKLKVSFYFSPDVATLLEEMRLGLIKQHGLAPSEATKSRIVEVAIMLQREELDRLAGALRARA